MKRLVTVLDVLLLIMGATLMFCFYAVFWGDSLFWLKVVGTFVVSIVLLRNINNVLEKCIEETHITKATDDIITAFKAFKEDATAEVRQENTPTPTEDEKTWYEKKLDELRAKNNKLQEDFLYRENTARDYAEKFDENKSFEEPSLLDLAPSICSMYFDSKNRLNSIDDATSSYEQIEKKYSALRRNERNLKTFLKNLEKELSDNEHLEGMSPIARHKYEKELKSKAKRPSAKVKSSSKNPRISSTSELNDIISVKTKNPKSTKNTKR